MIMKKITFLILSLTLFLVVLGSSCKKCSTCIANDKTTGVQVNSQEFCGESADVTANEDTYKSTYGLTSDVTCTAS